MVLAECERRGLGAIVTPHGVPLMSLERMHSPRYLHFLRTRLERVAGARSGQRRQGCASSRVAGAHAAQRHRTRELLRPPRPVLDGLRHAADRRHLDRGQDRRRLRRQCGPRVATGRARHLCADAPARPPRRRRFLRRLLLPEQCGAGRPAPAGRRRATASPSSTSTTTTATAPRASSMAAATCCSSRSTPIRASSTRSTWATPTKPAAAQVSATT